MVSEHTDEQMSLDSSFNLVIDRPQAEIGLQTAKHRFQIGQHGVRAPERCIVLIDERRAQAIHARIHRRAALFGVFFPCDGSGKLAALIR